MKRTVRLLADLVAVAVATAASATLSAADAASLEERLNALETQNQLLRKELDDQKQLIDDLQSRLNVPEIGDVQIQFTLSVKGLPQY